MIPDLAFIRLNTVETKLPWIEVKIDGSSITPTPMRQQVFPFEDFDAPKEFSKDFTIFGHGGNISSGSHTLTVTYSFQNLGDGSGRTCWRGYPFSFGNRVDDPFHIEIEEIP